MACSVLVDCVAALLPLVVNETWLSYETMKVVGGAGGVGYFVAQMWGCW